MIKQFIHVNLLLIGLTPSFAGFSVDLPVVREADLDMQYCEKKLQNVNQKTILRMNLLSIISEKQNSLLSGEEIIKKGKISRSINLSTQSFQKVNSIHFKEFLLKNTLYICAYKKRE